MINALLNPMKLNDMNLWSIRWDRKNSVTTSKNHAVMAMPSTAKVEHEFECRLNSSQVLSLQSRVLFKSLSSPRTQPQLSWRHQGTNGQKSCSRSESLTFRTVWRSLPCSKHATATPLSPLQPMQHDTESNPVSWSESCKAINYLCSTFHSKW